MLKELFARVLGVPLEQINDDISTRNVRAWDSVSHVELIVSLEEAYGVSFSGEDIIVMNSMQGVRKVLQGKGIDPA